MKTFLEVLDDLEQLKASDLKAFLDKPLHLQSMRLTELTIV